MSNPDGPTHITHVRTVGIPVSDQDRALDFWVGALGFEKRSDYRYGEGQRWVEVAPPGASTSIALVPARDGYPAGVDTGIRLTTTDAAADHAALKGAGVAVRDEIIPYPVPMFTLQDVDGNTLFVVQGQELAFAGPAADPG